MKEIEKQREVLGLLTDSVIRECKHLGISEKDTKRIILEHPILNEIESSIINARQTSIDIDPVLIEPLEGNE